MTVIATGFDAAVASQSVSPEHQTPVDLQHYTSHLKAKTEAPATELGRLSIARRPALDLSAAVPQRPAPKPGADAADVELDALSAFDVPAFLRREG